MPDAADVPPQNIRENGFRGFLPSTWSENSLEVFPDEILGKDDVSIEWNGTRTLTIEKDMPRVPQTTSQVKIERRLIRSAS